MAKPKIEKRTKTYVNGVFDILQEQPEVKDIIVLNHVGNPVRTTMEKQAAVEYSGYYEMLTQKVRYILQQIDPEDELIRLRVRTKYDETLITPDGRITLIVVQDAKDTIQPMLNRLPEKSL